VSTESRTNMEPLCPSHQKVLNRIDDSMFSCRESGCDFTFSLESGYSPVDVQLDFRCEFDSKHELYLGHVFPKLRAWLWRCSGEDCDYSSEVIPEHFRGQPETQPLHLYDNRHIFVQKSRGSRPSRPLYRTLK
jgi:hypothetical protein